MIVYRMHGTAHGPFDATGSFLHPGRWHSAGTRVIYAAEHASLATLETLIHAGGRRIPARVITRIHIPDAMAIESAGWLELPASQGFGDRWAEEKRSAILRVPSIAVNKMESNFVLNPLHPEFVRIEHSTPEPFLFQPGFFVAR